MGMSVAAMAGQNFGAGEYKRIKRILRVSLQIAVTFAALLFIWIQISPESVLAIFTSDQLHHRQRCALSALGQFGISDGCGGFSIERIFNGCGRTRFTMLNGLLATIVVRAPLAFLFGASACLPLVRRAAGFLVSNLARRGVLFRQKTGNFSATALRMACRTDPASIALVFSDRYPQSVRHDYLE